MIRRILGGVVACALFSCSSTPGGSGGGASDSCGAVDACGGNLVGTWTASDACVMGGTSSVVMGDCTATTSITSAHVAGTATFRADGTYTTDSTITLTTTIDLPAACLNQGVITLTCPDLGALIATSVDDEGGSNATCSIASGGGCSCLLTETQPTTAGAGTYTTSGTSLTTTTGAGDNSGSTDNYCVAGSHLHLISASSSTNAADGGMGPTTTVDVVLTK